MNKQELANKIWKTANDMRSTIEANEYKDFILGFAQFKKIVALSNLIQRIYHNDIRNMLP